MSEPALMVKTLPAGTVVHIGGIPFELMDEARLGTHPNNYKLAGICATCVGLEGVFALLGQACTDCGRDYSKETKCEPTKKTN